MYPESGVHAEKLQELSQEGQQNGGDKSGDGQGKAADRAGQLTHFRCLGGADHVGCGAEGNTLGNLILQPEQPAQERANDIAENAGDSDGSGGDGANAADFLAEGNADGSGDGLGKQRRGQRLVQTKEIGKQIDITPFYRNS